MLSLERLSEPRFRWQLGLTICLMVALGVSYFQLADGLSRRILDRQFNFLQQRIKPPIPDDVVVVGIDEASFKKFREPFELWHPHLAGFLQAMSEAKPRLVGLDVPLPVQSYQFLLPNYGDGMVQALKALSAETPVVLARKLDADGSLRQLDDGLTALVTDTPGSVMLCPDVDGVVRRFDLNLCTVNAQGTSFAEKIAAKIGAPHPGVGLVDFSAGQKFDFIPFSRVLEWKSRQDLQRLRATFSNRVVLLGFVSERAYKLKVPVPLAVWAPMDKQAPDVLVQAQILRSMTGKGLIRDLAGWEAVGLALLAAFFWMGRSGWIKVAVLALFPVAAWLLSVVLLGKGMFLPLGEILISGLFAFLARLAYESWQLVSDRKGLRSLFDSYVDREVLDEIVSGKIDASPEGGWVRVCLLHARIEDFNTRVQDADPQDTVYMLNEYLSEMRLAIHQHKGTLDRFSGSELSAFFGAPKTLETPERNALEAAQEMLLRQRVLNDRLQAKGLQPIRIEIALHVGQVVVGHVGSAARKEYTALGQDVGVVKALVELVRQEGRPVVCTSEVAEAVDAAAGIAAVGSRQVGDANLQVYAWTPPLLGNQ